MGVSKGIRAVTWAVAVSTFSPALWAQAAASDSASAEALFETGKTLLDQGKVADACPKFEESLRLDDAIGTRFQLARCYEALGRTASAWTLYLEVAAKAKASGQSDRDAYARGEAARLKPGLSTLTIVVPAAARAQGLKITRGGAEVGSGQWELALPVDPGKIEISATAPGKRDFHGSVNVDAKADAQTFTLSPLEDGPPGENGSGKRGLGALQWVGIGAGGLGLVGFGVAGFFALHAKSENKASGCVNGDCPNSEALSRNATARSDGNIATVATIAGGVLAVTGVTLFLVGPRRGASNTEQPKDQPEAHLEPLVAPGFAGAQLGGSF
jgi:hypothetical protein